MKIIYYKNVDYNLKKEILAGILCPIREFNMKGYSVSDIRFKDDLTKISIVMLHDDFATVHVNEEMVDDLLTKTRVIEREDEEFYMAGLGDIGKGCLEEFLERIETSVMFHNYRNKVLTDCHFITDEEGEDALGGEHLLLVFKPR